MCVYELSFNVSESFKMAEGVWLCVLVLCVICLCYLSQLVMSCGYFSPNHAFTHHRKLTITVVFFVNIFSANMQHPEQHLQSVLRSEIMTDQVFC